MITRLDSGEHRTGRSDGGRTNAQRAGIRRTVTIVVLFVLAVFAWTIIGRMIK